MCKRRSNAEAQDFQAPFKAFSSLSFPAVLTPAPSYFSSQLMLQPAKQATRLLTLGNASPCRVFQTGGLFQQVTANSLSARLCHLHQVSPPSSVACCSTPSFSSFPLCCLHDNLHLNSSHHHDPEQHWCLPCVCPFWFSLHSSVTQQLLSSLSNVIWISVSVCISLLSGRSPWAPAVSQHNKGHISLCSPFICSCQYRLHLPAPLQGNCDLGERERQGTVEKTAFEGRETAGDRQMD